MAKITVRKPADIAAVIRAAREDSGSNQQELAEKLGFSRDYMIDLESAKPTLYMSRLLRVFHELGVKVTLEFGNDDASA